MSSRLTSPSNQSSKVNINGALHLTVTKKLALIFNFYFSLFHFNDFTVVPAYFKNKINWMPCRNKSRSFHVSPRVIRAYSNLDGRRPLSKHVTASVALLTIFSEIWPFLATPLSQLWRFTCKFSIAVSVQFTTLVHLSVQTKWISVNVNIVAFVFIGSTFS